MERNLMIAGFGGQGVMTMGKLLAEATSQATCRSYIPGNRPECYIFPFIRSCHERRHS